MPRWKGKRRGEKLPEFRLTQHKQYLEYCHQGVEHKERERYLKMTAESFHHNRTVTSSALLGPVPEFKDTRVKEFEARLKRCNYINFHNIISEPLGYYCFCLHIASLYDMTDSEFWMEVMSYEVWKSHRHSRWIQRKVNKSQRLQQEKGSDEVRKLGSRMGIIMGLELSDSADSQYNEQLERGKTTGGKSSKWDLAQSTHTENKMSESDANRSLHTRTSVLFGSLPDSKKSRAVSKDEEYQVMGGAKKLALINFLIKKGYHDQVSSFHQKTTTCTEEKSTTLHVSESGIVGSEHENAPKSCREAVYKRLREEEVQNFKNSSHYKTYIRHLYMQQQPVKADDFSIVKMLGQGGFGKVFCCRKIDSGKLYAVKCLAKTRIIQKKAISMTKLEKDSMARLRSRFIVGLDFACQDHDNLYLVMTVMTGGNLRYHLRRDGFGEHVSRFFAAQILLGLEHMHKLRILYRDLKLDNVLLDHRGHCRLSDLGLCGILPVGKQKTRYAGTPGYMAPEVIMRRPYDMSADIWSFGVCLYRMIAGHKPFDGPNRLVLNKNVIAANPSYNSNFSEKSKSLLKSLLQKTPLARPQITDIKANAFFEPLSWTALQSGLVKPPFVPCTQSLHAPTTAELCNIPFDKNKKKEDKKMIKRLEERFKHTFDDWDYVSPAAVQAEVVEALRFSKENAADSLQTMPNACCVIA